jgi:chromosome partitioning protein
MLSRVVFNKKGGVGKTTIACNLAAVSAASGQRTLVIDLDPQANASHYLLNDNYAQVKAEKATILDFFRASLEGASVFAFNPFLSHLSSPSPGVESYIQETAFKNLFVIASHPDLLDVEAQLVNKHKIYKLKEMVEKLESFDEIFIDTPPAMNFFSQSALIAATRCLIPFDCDAFSKDAIYEVGQHIAEIQNDHNPKLVVEGIVVNQFSSQAKYPAKIVNSLIEEGLPILKTTLSSSVKIRESHHQSMPMVYLSPNHKLAKQYQALYAEINR